MMQRQDLGFQEWLHGAAGRVEEHRHSMAELGVSPMSSEVLKKTR